MGTGRVVAVVVGALLVLSGGVLLAAGGALGFLAKTRADDNGFISGPTYRITSPQYAVASERFDLGGRPGAWLPVDVAEIRIAARSVADRPMFLGVGPAEEVARYLTNVAHATVVDLGVRSAEVTLRQYEGTAPAAPPGAQTFWVRTSEGGQPEFSWDLRQGVWAIVMMNADGSMGIEAEATVAVHTPLLLPFAVASGIVGLCLAIAGVVVLFVALSPDARPDEAVFSFDEVGYPAALYGDIDPALSRWRWLVKWFLAIPHLVILGFLWAAYAVLTVVAFVSILSTGRYPRGIFDFNVGVLRWTWRVGFYAFNPAATDRYPPFSMSAGSYPADLNIEYPQELSRGLVLVKWWLLAIPHYIIVGFFTGGLLGILVLVAAVILLATGRYPRGLFDLVMGLNRWTLRVAVYASLMRDEYPPFRLDLTPSDDSVTQDSHGVPGMV